MNFLKKNGIETKIYHKPLIPNSSIFKKYKRYDLTNSNIAIKEILSLPANEKLTDVQVQYIISKIQFFFQIESI